MCATVAHVPSSGRHVLHTTTARTARRAGASASVPPLPWPRPQAASAALRPRGSVNHWNANSAPTVARGSQPREGSKHCAKEPTAAKPSPGMPRHPGAYDNVPKRWSGGARRRRPSHASTRSHAPSLPTPTRPLRPPTAVSGKLGPVRGTPGTAHVLALVSSSSAFWMLFTTHSMPSCSPSPVLAEHAWICHARSRTASKLRLSAISLAPIADSRSCLLAKTSAGVPASLSSSNNAASSLPASSRRRRSAESITKMSASVLS
mmetsp:Transcript_92591/g.257565  ORF Transcript_92591/g.257565 Transcript_92591/m.257565 type:complete len:262 (+) Transcript_92591:47-832(+)